MKPAESCIGSRRGDAAATRAAAAAAAGVCLLCVAAEAAVAGCSEYVVSLEWVNGQRQRRAEQKNTLHTRQLIVTGGERGGEGEKEYHAVQTSWEATGLCRSFVGPARS